MAFLPRGPAAALARGLLAALMLTATPPAVAVDGLNLAGGTGARGQNHDDFRSAVQWDWSRRWLERTHFHFTGYWDLSLAHFRTDERRGGVNDDGPDSLTALAFAPVLRLQFRPLGHLRLAPYLELGIGIAAFSDDRLRTGRRNSLPLGSRLLFEDRGVVGLRFGEAGRYELAYQRIHYSNANLADQNHGLDTHLFMFGVRF